MKAYKSLLLLAMGCVASICAKEFEIILANKSKVPGVQFQLKIVPVMQTIDGSVKFNPKFLVYDSMFNGTVPFDTWTSIFKYDSSRLYLVGIDTDRKPSAGKVFFFEWELFAIANGTDIPLGRMMYGVTANGAQYYMRTISQTTIDADPVARKNFDGFSYSDMEGAKSPIIDRSLLQNLTSTVYGSTKYYGTTDTGLFVAPSGEGIVYNLGIATKAESVESNLANADRRIWADFTILDVINNGEYCSLPDKKHGVWDTTQKRCIERPCNGGKFNDYTYTQGTTDIRTNVCTPFVGSECSKVDAKGLVDINNNCILTNGQSCKLKDHLGEQVTGVVRNHSCELPEGWRCLVDVNPAVWSYQGVIKGGRCMTMGKVVIADYIPGMQIHVTIGEDGALAKTGDPCIDRRTGLLGIYYGEPSGVGARCVPR